MKSIITFFLSLLLTSVLFILTSNSLDAKNVELEQAKKIALNLFSENSGTQKYFIEIKEIIPVEYNGVEVFRIFNLNPQGYIIITADDNAEPLIGYGLNSNFSFDNAPSALIALLEEYKKEMAYIIEKKLVANEKIASKWEKFLDENYIPHKSYLAGTFLLETTWGQGNKYSSTHYNKYCPVDPNTGYRCIAGCTAVALAQILHYWDCRVFPDGTESYTPPGFSNPLPTVYFYNEDYNWNGMNHNSPDDDNAELIYHCGVAINVMYTDSSTGGYDSKVRDAMEDYFGIHTSGLLSKSAYETEWINMLKADIDAGRPIYYAGTGNNGRHGWVIDGYKTNNTFHCNWGWENSQGENDEWYLLSSLNPQGYDGFISSQQAILGAEPILDGCGEPLGPDLVCSSDVSFSVNIPGTASVAWSKSASLNQVGVNTNPTYTVNASTSGTLGYVTATIKNSQNRTVLTRTKEVWVGTPDHDNIMITGDDWVVPTNSIFMATASEDMYIDYYQWDLPYGFTITQGQGTNTIRFNAPTGFGTEYYGLQLHNTCGTIGRNYIMYEAPFKNALIFTPNPTTGETTLSIESATEETQFDINEEWDLEIYNNNQTLKEKKTKLKGNEYHLNTSGWKDGVYMLRVNYKNEILTGKLVVKR
jgi:hypothetical protein